MSNKFWIHTLENKLNTPWHVKTDSENTNDRTDYVCNIHGRPIMRLEPAGGDYTAQQYLYTRNIAQHWPELLAALVEATYTLETHGITPSESLTHLIKHCGGPDLSSRVDAAPLPQSQPQNRAKPKPKKDSVSRTKSSTERLLGQ